LLVRLLRKVTLSQISAKKGNNMNCINQIEQAHADCCRSCNKGCGDCHRSIMKATPTASPEPSERELQLLQYIAQGRSSKEIEEACYISEHTVKWRLRCMLSELDATGRTETIDIAMKPALLQWD
jgi:DNA-binding NarL/FixJ family response regulator